MSSNYNFEGKHIVVCGGAGGLGASAIRHFQQNGAQVSCIDLCLEKNGWTRHDVAATFAEHQKNKVYCVRADIGDDEACKNAMAEVAAAHDNKIDVLVDVAWRWAIDGKTHIMNMSNTDWENTLKNVQQSALAIKNATPFMPKGSSIILCGATFIGRCTPLGFGACEAVPKAAVQQLCREAAFQFADQQIRCNIINPGAMRDTPKLAHVAEAKMPDGKVETLEKVTMKPGMFMNDILMRRFTDTHEVCGVIQFLASDASSYLTAQELYVDGGKNKGMPLMPLENN